MHKAIWVVAMLASPLFSEPMLAGGPTLLPGLRANWSGPYQACSNKNELLKAGHMDLAVRIDTANPQIAAAFVRALQFWSSVLDMTYRQVPTSDCALALVDGTASVLHETNNVARAQFTDLAHFEAWIAFDPHATEYMSDEEVYATAVHELGHVFGLRHNPRATSIMYYLDCDGASVLDETDLRDLALRHALNPDLLKSSLQSDIPIQR